MSQSTRTRAAGRRDARAAAAAPDASGVFTHRQILTILIGLMMGMFLAALDQTVVSTAIRTIADDLQRLRPAGLGDHGVPHHLDDLDPAVRQAVRHLRPQAVLPVRDRDLHRRFGALRLRQSMYELAAFRAVQGIGAGGLISLALAIIGDIVPPRERAGTRATSWPSSARPACSARCIGGFFAGTGHASSASPAGAGSSTSTCRSARRTVVVGRVLHIPHSRRDHRIDWPGALALIVSPRRRADPRSPSWPPVRSSRAPQPAALLGDDQQRDRRDDQRQRAGPVDAVVAAGVRQVQHPQDDGEGRDAQRHVDVEDPAPAGDAEDASPGRRRSRR